MRIHIRIRPETLLYPYQEGMGDQLTAWYEALRAFPTRDLHSLSLSFDVTGPKAEFVDKWPGEIFSLWDFSNYTMGFLT